MALGTECHGGQMSKIRNDGLDEYRAEPFEQQQFGTVVVEGLLQVYFMSAACMHVCR